LSVPILRLRDLRLKAAAAVLGLGIAAVSMQTGLVTALGRGERGFALSLENGARPAWSVFEAIDRTGEVGARTASCNRDLLRSTVSIRLAMFDTISGEGQDAARAGAGENADAALRALLRCDPADGNAWLRLAIVDANMRGAGGFDSRLIDASRWAAPGEGWILRPRLGFEAQLLAAGLSQIGNDFGIDARSLAEAAEAGEIVALYTSVGSQAQAIIDEQVGLLPEDRQAALRPMFDAARAGTR
jgi:hypothetical protein